MRAAAETEILSRVVSTRMPTKWGTFEAIGFERDVSNGSQQVETALALVRCDLTEGAPLLRIFDNAKSKQRASATDIFRFRYGDHSCAIDASSRPRGIENWIIE